MRKLISAVAITGALAAGGIGLAGRRAQMRPVAARSCWATAGVAVTTTRARMAASCAATLYTCSVSAARTATAYTRLHRQIIHR